MPISPQPDLPPNQRQQAVKPKLLFVDDEERVLNVIQRSLKRKTSSWEIHMARSVDEALEKLRHDRFDAIISDISMPEKDGFDLLDQLKNTPEWRTIPVVFLTGKGDNELKRRALDLGASDLLNKPVAIEDVIARIRNVLRLKAYEDRIRNQNVLLEAKVRERTREVEESRLDIIYRLAKACEYRDKETGFHVERVGWYSRLLSQALCLDRSFQDNIFLASPVHDIGKIGISDEILLKPGNLTDEEMEKMREHASIGANILHEDPTAFYSYRHVYDQFSSEDGPGRQNPILKMAATIALTHHERWDGSGYPSGLAGSEIPLEGRIVAISDTFDALSSERPYKPAFPEEKVLAILDEESGSHFDPDIHAAFRNSLDEIRSIKSWLSDDS